MSPESEFSYKSLQAQYGNGIPCPPDYSFPTHTLDSWAQKQPDAPALHWVSSDCGTEKTLTYGQLAELSHRAAIALAGKGIKKVCGVTRRQSVCTRWALTPRSIRGTA